MAKNQKPINLALQGGGAHGAYAWGVMDRLLEDRRLDFIGISATSAGAMNAAAYAHGYYQGGPKNSVEGAREALHAFWYAISKVKERFGLFDPPWAADLHNGASEYAKDIPYFQAFMGLWEPAHLLAYSAMENFTRSVSPYDFNPLKINPLRDILDEQIDFEALRQCKHTKLFISATNVKTGKVKVFRTQEMTRDMVLASACLPLLYQAVEIGEDAYWDGGYMGNPSLWPLFYDVDTRDILIVHLNPIEREEIPKRPSEILNRINEISFNTALIKEMRAVAFVQKLLREDWLHEDKRGELRDIHLHSIRADQSLKEFSLASKYNTQWAFLCDLRDRGREAASEWLDRHEKDVGARSTVDLRKEFLEV
ncbi:MAG: patatin-like phospholipase family protein [Pseudomonadota bacterium]